MVHVQLSIFKKVKRKQHRKKQQLPHSPAEDSGHLH